MRKYRGKRVDTGEWVYGYLIGNDVIVGEIVEFTEEYFNCEWWCRVDPKTVGQFTGLHDHNGREIYEGDIDGDLDREFGFRHVVYKDGSYGLQYGDDADSFDPFILWERVEVIGNIHDNPELWR